VIEFKAAGFRVGDRQILDGLTLRVEAGETLVLLGRSGSGKTTALRMVNALLLPSSGEVRVEDRATREWDPVRLRRRIGYVIQESGLFPHFTVERNIGLVPRLEGWDEARTAARVRELLDMLGLPRDCASRYPRELSGGQRQRVGVARALAADPSVLLFDEPFGALDPVTRAEVQRQFAALSARLRKTSLFVTHDVREALSLATRIALLRGGKLELVAPPEEFRNSRLEEAQAFLACLH
jgi:osmoprotectant transport system ATP-binding protein